MPSMEEILAKLAGEKIDANTGFWQRKLREICNL